MRILKLILIETKTLLKSQHLLKRLPLLNIHNSLIDDISLS